MVLVGCGTKASTKNEKRSEISYRAAEQENNTERKEVDDGQQDLNEKGNSSPKTSTDHISTVCINETGEWCWRRTTPDGLLSVDTFAATQRNGNPLIKWECSLSQGDEQAAFYQATKSGSDPGNFAQCRRIVTVKDVVAEGSSDCRCLPPGAPMPELLAAFNACVADYQNRTGKQCRLNGPLPPSAGGAQ